MAIKVDKLLKVYKSNKGAYVCALKDISFNLPDTGMVFILGKSGCGKSTLLNLLGGLDGFDGGDIVIDGQSLKGFKGKDYDGYRNDYIGFVFQEHNLIEKESVRRNISLALDLQSSKDTEGKVDGILERVGLKDLSEQKCNCISGGQKQRVAIARALIKSPKLLLCDEPTGALDSETGADIFTLLKELSQERLVVVVSHDRESAEKYGDRIIELKDGEIISDSAPLEEVGEAKEKQQKKHGGLRFARAFTLGAGYIIAKPIRMAICLLLCLATLSFVGVTDAINAYDRDKALLYTMEESGSTFYSFGKAKVVKGNKFNVSSALAPMNKAEAEELTGLLEVDRADYIYTVDYRSCYRYFKEIADVNLDLEAENYNRLLYYSNILGFVEADESFLNDYGFSLLAGRLPADNSEIALPLFLYNFFETYGYDVFTVIGKFEEKVAINCYEDLLGKTVSLINGEIVPPPLTVTGIVDTNFIYKEQAEILFNSAPEYDGFMDDIENKIEMDIIHNSLFVCGGFNDYYTENNLGGKARGEDFVARVIAPFTGDSTTKLKNINVYTTRYGGKPVNTDKENSDCYHLSNYIAAEMWEAENKEVLKVLQNISIYLCIGLVAISALFILYYASGTIDEKRREIGILRALGASRRDMVKLTACEYGIFAAVTVAASLGISAIFTVVLDNMLTSGYEIATTFIQFGIRQAAVIASVAIIAVVVGVAVPLIRLLKKKPVDVIADRK